jgi:hypothetical protein
MIKREYYFVGLKSVSNICLKIAYSHKTNLRTGIRNGTASRIALNQGEKHLIIEFLLLFYYLFNFFSSSSFFCCASTWRKWNLISSFNFLQMAATKQKEFSYLLNQLRIIVY